MHKMFKYKLIEKAKQVKGLVSTGASIAETVAELPEKPKAKDWINAGMQIFDTGIDQVSSISDKEAGWLSTGWPIFFNSMVYDVLPHFPVQVINDGKEVYDIDGQLLMFRPVQMRTFVGSKTDRKKLRRRLAQELIQTFGPRMVLEFDGDFGHLREDDKEAPPGSRASALKEEIQDIFDMGDNYSSLLWGEPGVGKSCIIRRVVKELGCVSVSVEAKTLNSVHYDAGFIISYIVEMLEPSCLIIDDLDRVRSLDLLLSNLEKINRSVRLFLTSANNPKKFGKAERRPGRFNKVVRIDTVGEDVISQLIEGLPEKMASEAKDWPVDYVAALQKTMLRLTKAGKLDRLQQEFENYKSQLEFDEAVEESLKDDEAE